MNSMRANLIRSEEGAVSNVVSQNLTRYRRTFKGWSARTDTKEEYCSGKLKSADSIPTFGSASFVSVGSPVQASGSTWPPFLALQIGKLSIECREQDTYNDCIISVRGSSTFVILIFALLDCSFSVLLIGRLRVSDCIRMLAPGCSFLCDILNWAWTDSECLGRFPLTEYESQSESQDYQTCLAPQR